MRKSAHWLEELSPSESTDFFREIALSHACEGGAIGEQIAELIRRDDLRALCEFELDYEAPGLTAHQVRHLRQSLAFFQKLEDLDIGIDKSAVALQKFLEAEELCRSTNELFRKRRRGELSFAPRVESVLYEAQRKIADCLGSAPTVEQLDLHFGPGATRATRRNEASIRRKLAERLQCSEDLAGAIPFILSEMPHLVDVHSTLDRVDENGDEWARLEIEIIDSKLSFVPKSAKTYRSICTEPGLNSIVQLGIGSVMAKRLRAVGVDIRDQTNNQELAFMGSLTGDLATLDLSSASDTVSHEIVFDLLPLEWAMLLSHARCSHTLLPGGKRIMLEKFSSMGNGYTFPLETLIFWSLAVSATQAVGLSGPVSVYGDDIVVPTEAYDLLSETLNAVGFVVNKSKSYKTGPFRESCGKDFFSGTDVRPYYPKRWLSGQSLFVLHNFYVRRGDHERARRVLGAIHPGLMIFGPDGFGDGHLLGAHARRRSAKHTAAGYSGYFFDTFTTRSNKDKLALLRGEYVVPLYTVYRRSADDSFLPPPQGEVAGAPHLFTSLWNSVRSVGEGAPAPLPLPEGEEGVKCLSLPGVAGYKKISVYTLGG